MQLVTNSYGQKNLLIWRTESLFYVPERRVLAREWSHVRYTSLPYPDEPNLINLSLAKPLPFPDQTFDNVYSFHVAEHLSVADGDRVAREMYRVLKPGGVCRLSTPDLAFFAQDYLTWLDTYQQSPTTDHFHRYQWALLNVIDQAVRPVSGGQMGMVLQSKAYNLTHLRDLNGDLLEFLADPLMTSTALRVADVARRGLYVDGTPAGAGFRYRKAACVFLQKLINRLSPQWYLRLSRENNRWYYDPVFLNKQFNEAGFRGIVIQDYKTSAIPHWDRYNFDQSAFGDYPLEPSAYIEGVK
ncbi:methyltransferase type 11 [Fibrisoma limi BUZ 3]|uniref:Methyltransferase type 11 n=1 Tax=Fibrisoma limi BUZ 3 TaxID=1185876 RepID=I2GJX3_9BACT|nr:class I SAM-dependent methyltransferase [Fibrisoma limi]CCH54198.1 methyltransferase type 11 [Fibrisoma limi BUZ 3]